MRFAHAIASLITCAAFSFGAAAQTTFTPTSYKVTLFKVEMSVDGTTWREVFNNDTGLVVDLASANAFASAFGTAKPIPAGNYKYIRMNVGNNLVWSYPSAPVSLSDQTFTVSGGPPGPSANVMTVYFSTHDVGGRPNMPDASGGAGTQAKPFLLGAGANIVANKDTTIRIVFAVTNTLEDQGGSVYDLAPPEMFFVTENGSAATLSGAFNTVLYNAEKKYSFVSQALQTDQWNYMSGHGVLTFDGAGGWTWAGTTNDFDLKNGASGSLDTSATESGRYGVNEDGSFWMLATGQPGTLRGAKSSDGNMIFASMYDSASAHMMVFGVKQATAASVANMNTGYYFTTYGSRYDAGPTQLSYVGTFGVVTGDGTGSITGTQDSNTVKVTNPNTTPTYVAPTTNLASAFSDTLTVQTNGKITSADDALAGGILEDGNAAAIAFDFDGTYSSEFEFGFLVRQSPSGTFTNASLNGTYFGGHFGDVYAGGGGGGAQQHYFSGFFTIVFNGEGSATVTTLENREGTVAVETFTVTYSVNTTTGIVTFTDPGQGEDASIQGAIGPNAMSFILTANPQVNGQAGDQRFLGLGLKQ